MLDDLPILRGSLQLIFTLMAYYTGLSRIVDNKHHWSDVLIGLLQGTLVALLVARFLWPSYKRKWSSYLAVWPAQEGSPLLHVKAAADISSLPIANGQHHQHHHTMDDYLDPPTGINGQLANSGIMSMSRGPQSRGQHRWPDNGLASGEEQAVRLSYDEFVV